MKIGFTASRNLTKNQIDYINNIIQNLDVTNVTEFVTGGCVGGDTIIAKAVRQFHPEINHKLVIPYNTAQVDKIVYSLAHPKDNIIYMLEGTDYRDRNQCIVDNSIKMIAFWNGFKRSGTFMTINIARRAEKIIEEDIHDFSKIFP